MTVSLAACAGWVRAQPLGALGFGEDSLPALLPGDTVEIPIRLINAAPGFETGGFNLFFQYDTTAFRLLSAAPGSLLSACAWELFVWRAAIPSDCDGSACPGGLVHITALADYIIPVGEPLCWELSDGELVKLTFAVSGNPAVAGQTHLFRWYWYGCNDNEFASKNGDSVYQSRLVLDENAADVTADLPFPNTTGAPLWCIASSTITRRIDYAHRAIAIAADSLAPVKLRFQPPLLHAFQVNALGPVVCSLYIGNLAECAITDIDAASLRLNDTLVPLGAAVAPAPDGFFGDVLAVAFDARPLIAPLVALYDTATVPVAVSWSAPEPCVEEAAGELTVVGHRSGDVNGDGRVSIVDLTTLVAAVFRGGPIDPVMGDVDGSRRITVADITLLIDRLFR
ncbi:MAG TPA: dockerin type I domain-containing protein [candidate division Zixibacteria bacterium]|nr:hypothetical protein [candidate division Zixibacteria bacterium]MDD4916730.1 dockerin type I domain-containing protein [candidate division Zixibacteria bacterium]MDM7973576.1 dockerin type I domain-containing protein [candidate division Zixibacteria bacterium]HOZ08196.1 dockerin type I domain-containing protein [candidate division Zixibacteria bacterium]HPI33184.1 dockerin type I domain-containing protein [candidate division Zixibacteria bacterium]